MTFQEADMRACITSIAAAAILGVAGVASAATVTILDEGYTTFNGYTDWASWEKDTTVAYNGSSSLKLDSHSKPDALIHVRTALDVPLSSADIDPFSASLTFAYKFMYDSGPDTRTLEFGLQTGDWGYLNGFYLSGTVDLTGDGEWHLATINFNGWTTEPQSDVQIDWITIRNPADNWQGLGQAMTMHLDNFVFTSPVPEPTSLAVLTVGMMFGLRRRRS